EGQAFLYLGGSGGLVVNPAWTGELNHASNRFGESVAGAGDVDGDGYADVVVGSAFNDQASLFRGSVAGLPATPTWTLGTNPALSQVRVACAGDVNGDGYSDVLLGSNQWSNPEFIEGTALVWHGSANGPAATPSWQAEGNQQGARFGNAITSAGDVNGDG